MSGENEMKCKYCDSQTELAWPENWVKGIRPINAETGKTHECEAKTRFLFTDALLARIKSMSTPIIPKQWVNPAQSVWIRSVG